MRKDRFGTDPDDWKKIRRELIFQMIKDREKFQPINCKSCDFKWIPRFHDKLPDKCPRCKNDWLRLPSRKSTSKFKPVTSHPQLSRYMAEEVQ